MFSPSHHLNTEGHLFSLDIFAFCRPYCGAVGHLDSAASAAHTLQTDKHKHKHKQDCGSIHLQQSSSSNIMLQR